MSKRIRHTPEHKTLRTGHSSVADHEEVGIDRVRDAEYPFCRVTAGGVYLSGETFASDLRQHLLLKAGILFAHLLEGPRLGASGFRSDSAVNNMHDMQLGTGQLCQGKGMPKGDLRPARAVGGDDNRVIPDLWFRHLHQPLDVRIAPCKGR